MVGEDEEKANSPKMIDWSSNAASDGEVEQKLSPRQKLEHRPWLLIAAIVIIAALIGWLSYLAVVPAEEKLPTTDDYFPMPKGANRSTM